jgi:hypothetical protein
MQGDELVRALLVTIETGDNGVRGWTIPEAHSAGKSPSGHGIFLRIQLFRCVYLGVTAKAAGAELVDPRKHTVGDSSTSSTPRGSRTVSELRGTWFDHLWHESR